MRESVAFVVLLIHQVVLAAIVLQENMCMGLEQYRFFSSVRIV